MLAALCLNADSAACRLVEVSLYTRCSSVPSADMRFFSFGRCIKVYLRIQLGIKAFNDARHNEAVEQFTAAINSSVLSNEGLIYSDYEIFVIVRSYSSNKHDRFHTQLWSSYSCSGGISHPRCMMHTSIGATHSFEWVSR